MSSNMPKITTTTTQWKRIKKELDIINYTTVPGWVWPFECDICYEDIPKNGFHFDCWNKKVRL
jgi:hypothetical protein